MGKIQERILVVDDDIYFANYVADLLADTGGYQVTQSNCVDQGLRLALQKRFSLIIVDMKMPPGKTLGILNTSGGHKTGLIFAKEIRKKYASTRVLIHSASSDVEGNNSLFRASGISFLHKSSSPAELIRTVRRLIDPAHLRPRSFIVHGHDKNAALELKNYLQNRLGFDEPTLLAEQPSKGLTIMEKFEANAANVDWAFVLFYPGRHWAGRL